MCILCIGVFSEKDIQGNIPCCDDGIGWTETFRCTLRGSKYAFSRVIYLHDHCFLEELVSFSMVNVSKGLLDYSNYSSYDTIKLQFCFQLSYFFRIDMSFQLASADVFLKESQFLVYGNGRDEPPTGLVFDKQQLKGLYFNQSPNKVWFLVFFSFFDWTILIEFFLLKRC